MLVLGLRIHRLLHVLSHIDDESLILLVFTVRDSVKKRMVADAMRGAPEIDLSMCEVTLAQNLVKLTVIAFAQLTMRAARPDCGRM